MEIDIQDRKSELEGLNIFINHISSKLKTIFNTLDWDEESVTNKKNDLKACNINRNHRVPKHVYKEHTDKCLLRKEGYEDEEILLSEPNHHTMNTIIIDKKLQEQIINQEIAKDPLFVAGSSRNERNIPRSSNRITSDLTVDERRVIYDFAVAKTKQNQSILSTAMHIEVTPTGTTPSSSTKSITEILAEQRDAHRRRMKYKSVHTNRKSQTEILREVIENQMEMYAEYLKADTPTKTEIAKKQDEYIDKDIIKNKNKDKLVGDRELVSSPISNKALVNRNPTPMYDSIKKTSLNDEPIYRKIKSSLADSEQEIKRLKRTDSLKSKSSTSYDKITDSSIDSFNKVKRLKSERKSPVNDLLHSYNDTPINSSLKSKSPVANTDSIRSYDSLDKSKRLKSAVVVKRNDVTRSNNDSMRPYSDTSDKYKLKSNDLELSDDLMRSYEDSRNVYSPNGSVSSQRSYKRHAGEANDSRYREKLSKHQQTLHKFKEKINQYDEKISKYDEKVSKYDEKLRRYESTKAKRSYPATSRSRDRSRSRSRSRDIEERVFRKEYARNVNSHKPMFHKHNVIHHRGRR